MTSEVDQIVARAEAAIDGTRFRAHAVGTKAQAMRRAHVWRKAGRSAAASGAVIAGAGVFGAFVAPLGFAGLMVTAGLVAVTGYGFARWPRFKEPQADELTRVPLPQLAGRTEIWLEGQRAALPAPARALVDRIGTQLDLLAPQLQSLDDSTPAAAAVRKLVGEDLTALVLGYRAIPGALRDKAHAGRTPNDQLADGLALIEREIAETTRQLATGQLDQLAMRQRYLELKYDSAGGDTAGQ